MKIKEPVGPEAPNRRPDVAKVETFLDRTGYLDLAKAEGPTGYYGSRVDQGIRGFQKENALKVDGLINPDGETLQTLGALLSEGEQPSLRNAGLSPMISPSFAKAEAMSEKSTTMRTGDARPPLPDRAANWLGRRGAAMLAENNLSARPASALLPIADQRTNINAEERHNQQPASSPPGEGRTGAWFEGGLIPDTAGQDSPGAAEKYMRGKIERWRRAGLNDAADNLERYLQGNGGIVPLSRDEAIKFRHVREGETENTERFFTRTLLGRETKSASALKLKEMKDGEVHEVTDYWDSDYILRHAAE